MKSLLQKIFNLLNRKHETSNLEVTKNEFDTPIKEEPGVTAYDSKPEPLNNEANKHVRTITIDLSSWKPRPKKPISQKEIYYNDDIWRIGMTVEFRRKHLNLTQKQLSELLGFKSTSFVSNLELGIREKLTHEQLENLAKCLKTTSEKLLNDEVYD